MGQTRKETECIREVENLENVIFLCFGQPDDHEFLPQVENTDDVIIDIMQHLSGAPHGRLEVELHHQIDPSYQSSSGDF